MKISVDESKVIKTRLDAGENPVELAHEYDVHYETIRRIRDGMPRGRLSGTRKRYDQPIEKRYIVDEQGCWTYTGTIDRVSGYGATARGPAHRAFYEHYVGPIPAGMQIDHLCGVRPCVNPDHLEPVTQYENLRRAGFGNRRKEAA